MQSFIKKLKEGKISGARLTHYEFIKARSPKYGLLDKPLPDTIEEALVTLGIRKLYSHQAHAINLLDEGKNVVISTPTASGKSLIYHIHSLKLLEKKPGSHILYLFPVKALAQDQMASLRVLIDGYQCSVPFQVGIFDGDTKQAKRKKMKLKPPHIVISNPDMLHLSFLAYNHQWRHFLSSLRLVVVDEVHTYRGIFGSHVAQVLRRLIRLVNSFGIQPQFVFLTATIANPRNLAEALSGLECETIDECGAPKAPQHFFFIDPAETTANNLAAHFMVRAIRRGLKTIVFTQSRQATEVIHLRIRQTHPELGKLISSYRAGYLPEERRYIERQLMSGSIKGVISTSALEMGIDIGGLDVCVLVGYPGTVINTWQRGGRVGRGGQESAIVLIAQPDALDQYVVYHPIDFFGRHFEAAAVDPYNKEILHAHLPCAAAEKPLKWDEPVYDPEKYRKALQTLSERGTLLPAIDNKEWYSSQRYPHRTVDIRGIGEGYNIAMELENNGKTRWVSIGKSDGIRAFKECYPGAVYVHRGRQFIVKKLDVKRKNIEVEAKNVNYFTRVLTEKETEILEVLASKPVQNFVARLGRLMVTERITGYEKRLIRGHELMGVYPLELPPQRFETVGLWIEIDRVIQDKIESQRLHFMGGIHAMEHGAISMFPLFALCDRNDIGGIAYPFHPQVGKSAIFIYDGYSGGVGLSARGYEIIEELLRKTLGLIKDCSCEIGCPSCIHSPKCGAGNKPLDKKAAILCLKMLLGVENLMVKKVGKESFVEVKKRRREVDKQEIPRVAFFDIETQRLAEEVGGWENKHLMKLSVGVVYDKEKEEYLVFKEDEVDKLIETLKGFELVVGFNIKNFDYAVLQPYTVFSLGDLPTFDMLEYIYKKFGFRVSLDHLAKQTLGDSKIANGVKAVGWYRSGEMDKVIEYCKKDVDITCRLFLFGQENGYVLAKRKDAKVQKLVVDWDYPKIMPAYPED